MNLVDLCGSWSPERTGRALLGLLFLVISAGAVLSDLSTPWAVDERTQLEMIAGVAHHGLPAIDNGPSDEYPALQARWNVSRGGLLWGKYPPLFAYAMAPAYMIGGSRGVIRANILLLAVLALGVFDLARFLAPGPVAGAAAAWLAVAATSISGMALLLSPFVLTATGLVWSLNLSLRTASSEHPARCLAAATGVVAGATTSAHLLAFPAALVAVIGVGMPFAATRKAAGVITMPRSSSRWIWAVGGLAVPLGLMALINNARFGSPNPLSYGPCSWRICRVRSLDGTELELILDSALPLVAWVLVTAAALWRYRRSRAQSAAMIGLATVVLLGLDPLRFRAGRMVEVAAAFLVDVSILGEHFHHPYYCPPDGLGVLFGPYAVKALLQSTPIAALALFAVDRDRKRRPALLVAAAALAILGTVALRGAGVVGANKLGSPFINIRYVSIVEPLLVVLALVVLSNLDWRRSGFLLTAGAAVVLAAVLACTASDAGLLRRVLLLRMSLLSSLVAVALVAWSRAAPEILPLRRAAAIAVALTVVVSVGISSGVDLAATAREISNWDRFASAVGRALPHRFAIVGFPGRLDPVLSLRQERDLEYADLFEMADQRSLGPLVRHWRSDGRQVFVLMPTNSTNTDTFFALKVEPVAADIGLYRFAAP